MMIYDQSQKQISCNWYENMFILKKRIYLEIGLCLLLFYRAFFNSFLLPDAPLPLTTLSDNLYTLVNNEEFADCTFVVEGQKVYGHKAILASRSDYFRAMFSDGMKEARGGKVRNCFF